MATMIWLMQPNDLSSSSSSILCLLPIEPVCLPLATDNKPFKAHTFGVYPLAELFSDVLLCFALTDEFKQRGATKCACSKVKAEVHKCIELPLRLAYTKVINVVLARQKVSFKETYRLCFGNFLTLLDSSCVTDTDCPYSCGASVCGQLAAFEVYYLVKK